jgi:putative transposase
LAAGRVSSATNTEHARAVKGGAASRLQCLSIEWFRSRAEAKVVIETWRLHFNAIRPHSSLNYLTPLEFKQQHHPVHNRAAFQE